MPHSCKRPSYWRVFAGNIAGPLVAIAGASVGYFVVRKARRATGLPTDAEPIATAEAIGLLIGGVAGVVGYAERAIISSPSCRNPSIGRLALSALAEAFSGGLLGAGGRAVGQQAAVVASLATPFVVTEVSRRLLKA
jgi:hypothetical protein